MTKTLYQLSEKLVLKKTLLKNFGLIKEQKCGKFKKFCKEKDIEVYSTTSETEAAFAEKAIQSSKHIIYRYIKDHGDKFVPKLQQFASTLNCRKNRSIGKSPRDVKNSD